MHLYDKERSIVSQICLSWPDQPREVGMVDEQEICDSSYPSIFFFCSDQPTEERFDGW